MAKDALKEWNKLQKQVKAALKDQLVSLRAALAKHTISRKIAKIEAILGGENKSPKAANVKVDGRKKRRKMSPEAKAKIAAAQKKRWAKFHADQKK